MAIQNDKFCAVLVFIAIALPACGQSVSERASNDQVTFVPDGDPAMNRAFEKARASLDEFFRLAQSPPESTESYAIKVAVRDDENTEYFSVKTYKLGERFTFSRAQVVDWTYLDLAARRMHGNFTACALLTHEDPVEAEEFRKQYGLQCD